MGGVFQVGKADGGSNSGSAAAATVSGGDEGWYDGLTIVVVVI